MQLACILKLAIFFMPVSSLICDNPAKPNARSSEIDVAGAGCFFICIWINLGNLILFSCQKRENVIAKTSIFKVILLHFQVC